MFTNNRTRNVLILVVFSLLVGSLSLLQTVSSTNAEEPSTIYLPLSLRNFPAPPTVFGAEAWEFTDPELIQLAVNARVSWIRLPVLDWSKIEPTAPTGGIHNYDWSQVPEDSLLNISSNHMYAIATVKMTPAWAQKYPGIYCGPIAQENFDEFATFMQAAVQRYSQPPYNVHYWEFGNEPDVAPGLVAPNSVFGCWGDDSDSYYGGGYYAQMLKAVYPAIKAVDPQAQVLIGGLLLDCDPDDPQCSNTTPPKFFEGILRNGGGAYFDLVSYHGYPSLDKDGTILDENFASWDQRGGVVLGKAAFLKEIMAQYGIDKPLFHTEGALLCPDWNDVHCVPEPGAIYQDAKADYVIWLYVRALANDFEGSIWYTLDGGGWRNGGLIGDINDPNPAYFAFKFLTKELSGAQFIGQPLGTSGDLRSYAFAVTGKTVWVVWSADNSAHTLVLPEGYTNVYDKLGNPVDVSDDVLEVKSPIFIELP